MRIAVSGCGSIGLRHVRNLLALGVEEVVVADPLDERVAEAVAAGAVARPDLRALIAARPDALFICTPAVAHLEAMRAGAAAGIDLFVEKPISHDLTGVREALADLARGGRVVQVGYAFRSHRSLRLAKETLDAGAIGRVVLARAEFGQYLPDWRPGRDYREGYNARAALGGGVLLDQSHELDYLRWLLGEVRSVSSRAAKLSDLDIDAEDVALVTLEMRSGALALAQLDSVRRDYTRACTLIGTEGTITWSFTEGTRLFTPASGWTVIDRAPDPNDMYIEEVRGFLERMRSRARPEVDGDAGVRALELALAAKRSAHERRVVALP